MATEAGARTPRDDIPQRGPEPDSLLGSRARANARPNKQIKRFLKVSAQESSSVASYGTVFADQMGMCAFKDGRWNTPEMIPTGPIPMHPAAHVLHYGSACFEGLKAYRWADGTTRMFRMDMHVKRMIQSAQKLYLPVPGADMLSTMIRDTTVAARSLRKWLLGALVFDSALVNRIFGTDFDQIATARFPVYLTLAMSLGALLVALRMRELGRRDVRRDRSRSRSHGTRAIHPTRRCRRLGHRDRRLWFGRGASPLMVIGRR